MRRCNDPLAPMRRLVIAGAAFASVAISTLPRHASAQAAVACVNCSTTWGLSRHLGDHAALARAESTSEIRSNRCPTPAPSVPL
jgi:hypothetical protein